MTEEIREAFERARANVDRMQRAMLPAPDITVAHTGEVDGIVIAAYDAAIANTGRDPAGVSLVALGGYGRADLAPNSDLDLLLLYRGWPASELNALNRAVMYPLWDSRRELGDRVREPRDVVRSFEEIDEVCALLDARLLAGDRGLFADMQGAVARKVERGRASFFAQLRRSTSHRHLRYGHAGHLLEPNIRDSAGGLRDIHTLGWASKVLPGSDGLDGLVETGHLSRFDADLVDQARAFFLRLRIELHLLTARHQDQLYLAEQDELARRLSYAAAEGRPSADRLMQELFMHARQVDAVTSSFWDRISHQRRRRRWRASGSRNVGDGCVLQEGRLEVVAVTRLVEDPAGWLRVFRRAASTGSHLGRMSSNRLVEELFDAGPVRWTSEAREVFLDILKSGGLGVLEDMDLAGMLVWLVPEWEAIRAFPQRDLYHRYSVDRHLFAAVGELATSRSSDESHVRDAWVNAGDPDALFVATLFHDIGKGRGGDHSVLGADLAEQAGRRMNLPTEQLSDVVYLVRNHLLLAEIAVRRDLNDPATIEEIARRVGDERRLAMLYLMTRADSLATGPEAWSSFRAALVRELYGRVAASMAGAPAVAAADASERLSELAFALELSLEEAAAIIGPMPDSWIGTVDADAATRQIALLRERLAAEEVRTAVHHAHEADEFIVVAPDRPGLFSTVTGVLALRGLDVHDAEIYTRSDGVALEVFRVIGQHGSIPDERWSRLRSDIVAALGGDLDLDAALSKKATQSRSRSRDRKRDRASRVIVDNGASSSHTVVEVHTEDRIGLLRTITKSLADAGCDLSLAKVATYGIDVVDVFYVRDLEGHKIEDAAMVAAIEECLREAVEER